MLDLDQIDADLDALGEVPDDLVVPMNISEDIEAVDVELDRLAAGLASVTASGMPALPRSERPSKGPAERSWPRPSQPPLRRSSTPPHKRASSEPSRRSSRPAPWSDPLAAASPKAEAKRASKPVSKPASKLASSPAPPERKSAPSQKLPTPGPVLPLDPARVDADTEALLGESAASNVDAETDALLSEPPPPAASSQPPHQTDISQLLEAELDPSEFPQTPMSPPSLPAAAKPRAPSQPDLDEEGFELLVDDDDILEIVEDDD
jgi:hypothetical protein